MTWPIPPERLENEGWFTATPGADAYAWTALPGHDWALRTTGWVEGEAKCSCGWESGTTRTNGADWVNHLPLYELGERASQQRLWGEVQRLHALLVLAELEGVRS